MLKRILLPLIFVSLLSSTIHAEEQDVTKVCRDKLVCDLTDLLSPEQSGNIAQYHQALLERYDIDMRVIVASDLGDLGLKTAEVFKAFSVGEKSKTRKGVLLVIDPGQDKVRMEISAGLDAVYTDGFITYLQSRQMIPFFTAGRVADGVLATTELIVDRAQKAAMKQEFVSPDVLPKNLTIGAGAQGEAKIAEGFQRPAGTNTADVAGAGMSPTQVVAAYHQALAQGNASPTLSIYSRATQNMKKSWVVTAAQMKTELQMYKSCQIDKIVSAANGSVMIVRYGVRQRTCAPYFLVKEDGEWKLDFAPMMNMIRFNVDNQWRFDPVKTPRWVFEALSDWQFDKNGYPY